MGVSNSMAIFVANHISEIARLPTEEAEHAPKRNCRNANRLIAAIALPAESHSDGDEKHIYSAEVLIVKPECL